MKKLKPHRSCVGTMLEGMAKGPGHQMADITTAVIVHKWFGLAYAHSPFIAAAEGAELPVEGNFNISAWEYFWQLGRGHPSVGERLVYSDNVQEIFCHPHRFAGHAPSESNCRLVAPHSKARLAQVKLLVNNMAKDDALLLFRRSARLCTLPQLQAWEKVEIAPAGITEAVRLWWWERYWPAHFRRVGEQVKTDPNSRADRRRYGLLKEDEFVIAALYRTGGSQWLRKQWLKNRDEIGDLKWLEVDYPIAVLGKLRDMFPGARLVVFSDGPEDVEELSKLRDAGFTVHVCCHEFPGLFDVFHALITADILVCGNSGFSAFSGFIENARPVIQPEPCGVRIPAAIKADRKTGDFDTDLLKRKLANHE